MWSNGGLNIAGSRHCNINASNKLQTTIRFHPSRLHYCVIGAMVAAPAIDAQCCRSASCTLWATVPSTLRPSKLCQGCQQTRGSRDGEGLATASIVQDNLVMDQRRSSPPLINLSNSNFGQTVNKRSKFSLSQRWVVLKEHR